MAQRDANDSDVDFFETAKLRRIKEAHGAAVDIGKEVGALGFHALEKGRHMLIPALEEFPLCKGAHPLSLCFRIFCHYVPTYLRSARLEARACIHAGKR